MPETDEFVSQLAATYRTLPAGPVVEPGQVQRSVRRRRTRRIGAAIGVAAVIAAAISTLGSGPSGPLPVRPLGAALSESRSSDTANDWARLSDAVVVAKVVDEKQTSSATGAHGSNESFASRDVTLRVDELLWAPTKIDVPDQISVQAAGWIARDGKLTFRMTISNSPRLEVGHTYVLALLKDRCGLAWAVLGSQGALPYDHDTLGTGEVAGKVTTYTVDQAGRSPLARQVAGKDASALIPVLGDAFVRQGSQQGIATC